LNCSFWQIAQVGPLNFEVRYVPLHPPTPPGEASFISLFRSIYFDDAIVTFRRVDSIAPATSGKYVEYVYEA
jgi:phenylacetate-CoA ligase